MRRMSSSGWRNWKPSASRSSPVCAPTAHAGQLEGAGEYLYQQKASCCRAGAVVGMYFTRAGRKRLEANPGAPVELPPEQSPDVINRTWDGSP
ncbi:MAG: hypothetical protein LC121_26210 [Anaerolineae bacterium]|nr:hypothetical protein [Anaerolineae bacterium]